MEDISKRTAATVAQLAERNSTVVDVARFTQRERFMDECRRLMTEAKSLYTQLHDALETLTAVHDAEKNTMGRLMHHTVAKRDGWSLPRGRRAPVEPASSRQAYHGPQGQNGQHGQQGSQNKKFIQITHALGLWATVVDSFSDVQTPGELYYVEKNDHFAIILAGQMLHGNIGQLYIDDKTPRHIKKCRFGFSCSRGDTCYYYHDPVEYPTSRECRNYIASGFIYAGGQKTRARKFGSRPNLDMDIINVSDDDADLYADQLMHDILCVLLLRTARRARN